MKNIVSFDTAKRLKEAGFPQPSARFGQFWYNEISKSFNCIGFDDLSTWSEDLVLDGYFFAPTATDILQKLGYMWGISVVENGLFYCAKSAYKIEETKKGFVNQSPAEAAALAFLAAKSADKIQRPNDFDELGE